MVLVYQGGFVTPNIGNIGISGRICYSQYWQHWYINIGRICYSQYWQHWYIREDLLLPILATLVYQGGFVTPNIGNIGISGRIPVTPNIGNIGISGRIPVTPNIGNIGISGRIPVTPNIGNREDLLLPIWQHWYIREHWISGRIPRYSQYWQHWYINIGISVTNP